MNDITIPKGSTYGWSYDLQKFIFKVNDTYYTAGYNQPNSSKKEEVPATGGSKQTKNKKQTKHKKRKTPRRIRTRKAKKPYAPIE